MKQLFAAATFMMLLFCGNSIQAQHTTYRFQIKNNWGLCDSTGKELIKPQYDYVRHSDNKKLTAFYPSYDNDKLKVQCYEAATGAINSYERIYFDNVVVDGKTYHFLEKSAGKCYLLQADNNDPVVLKGNILDIDNIGSRYLVQQYFPTQAEIDAMKKTIAPTTKEALPKKGANGKYIFPPPVRMPAPPTNEDDNYYIFFKNSFPLQPVLKINAGAYLPLYLTNETDARYMQNIRKYNSTDFDYIVFKKENQLHLYDSTLKLIKKIPYTVKGSSDKIDEAYTTAKIGESLGKKVYSNFLIYPSKGASSSNMSNKAPDAFVVRRSDNGLYQLINHAQGKTVFESPYKFEYDNSDYSIDFENENAAFYINNITGKPYLPQQYYKVLKIVLMQ